MVHWNSDKLVKFEEEIAILFNSGEIKFPIHLSNGNEENLIEIFKEIPLYICK